MADDITIAEPQILGIEVRGGDGNDTVVFDDSADVGDFPILARRFNQFA